MTSLRENPSDRPVWDESTKVPAVPAEALSDEPNGDGDYDQTVSKSQTEDTCAFPRLGYLGKGGDASMRPEAGWNANDPSTGMTDISLLQKSRGQQRAMPSGPPANQPQGGNPDGPDRTRAGKR